MRGAYSVSVQNNRVKYEFTISRSITIVRGDSATGKTTLVDLVREYQLDGADSGVNVSCERPCVVLEGNMWKQTLRLFSGCIVFIDEGNRFVSSVEFASEIKRTDNYYVIVARESLECLPYSVNEIYGIHTSGKYAGLKQVYHEFYHIYGGIQNIEKKSVGRILAEDSNSGFEFFSGVSKGLCRCESAQGKSNIFKFLKESDEMTLVVADGAAFGSQMEKVSKLAAQKKNCILYLPESFEYLILQSGILKDAKISEILEEPSSHIESKDFFSWEQFFTALLTEKSNGTYLKYSKRKLNSAYLADSVKNRILNSPAFAAVREFLVER